MLVATGPDPQSEQTIRSGKRLADALNAEWTVVYVETPALLRLSEKERDRRVALLRLAESLGAETVTLDGPSAVDALLEYATTRQFTRVVVGAPKRRGWRALVAPVGGDRAGAAGARFRRHHHRRARAADPAAAAAGRARAADPLEPLRRGARDHGGLHAASRSSCIPISSSRIS